MTSAKTSKIMLGKSGTGTKTATQAANDGTSWGRGRAMGPLMTTAEVAKVLRISSKAVLRYTRQRKNPLRASKVGRGYLFDQSDVMLFLEQRRVVRGREE